MGTTIRMIKRRIDSGIDFLLAMMIISMTGIVVIQVFFRYVLNNALPWPEEIARLLIVWLTFIGGYMAMREKKHVGFNLLLKKMPLRTQKIIMIIADILIAIFLYVVITQGYLYARRFVGQPMPYTELSYGIWAYTVFPIGGSLMLIQAIFDLVDSVKKFLTPQHESKEDVVC